MKARADRGQRDAGVRPRISRSRP